MDWSAIYLVCFVLGLSVVGLLALLGHFGGGAHDGGGHDLAHDMADGVQGAHLPLFSPSVLSIFVGMFGAGGLALLKAFGLTNPLFHVTGAFGISLTSGFSTAWLMVRVMRYAESNSIGSHAQLIGRTVEVLAAIKGAEFGEIAFESGGTRQTLVAKSDGGHSFAQGEAVQVARVVEGIAYVAPVGTVSALQPVSLTSSSPGIPVDASSLKGPHKP
jgi:membrane protein implicated in regulation of membrane protease activity